MTNFDKVAEAKAEEEWRDWLTDVKGALDELIQMVHRERGGGEFEEIAGVSAFRDEKVRNEVEVMNFLRQNTIILVPRVISWGLTTDGPQDLGPFIIIDYVEGVHLSDLLQKPSDITEAPIVINPNVDNEMLDTVLSFPALRPLHKTRTGLRHGLVTWADDAYDAERLYIARHLFTRLAANRYNTERNHNTGPFKLFCDNFRPSNMLVDKTSLQITAVLDFEFTNAMPTQFAEEPAWWLLLRGPARLLDEGEAIEEFVTLYQPRLEQFLRALEHEEVRTGVVHNQTRCLSSLMRSSWKRGDFWFNMAARNSFDMDAVFYAYLDGADFGGNAGPHLPSEGLQEELKNFVEMKADQKVLHDLEFQLLSHSHFIV